MRDSRISGMTVAFQDNDRYAMPVVKLRMLFRTFTTQPSEVVKSTWSSAVPQRENDRRYFCPVFRSTILPSRTRENWAESRDPVYDGEYSEYSWFVPAITRAEPRISKLESEHVNASGSCGEAVSAETVETAMIAQAIESIANIVVFAIMGLKLMLFGSILNPDIL